MISESLLKRVEEGLQDADPCIFRKDTPLSVWKSGLVIQKMSFKLPSLKSSVCGKEAKGDQFELVTEKDAEKSAKGAVPRNTEKNDCWALNTSE